MSENVACYWCGHQPGRLLFSSSDFVHGIGGSFAWHQCPECGLIYLSPRPTPDEISLYYPPDYALFRATAAQQRWWHLSGMMQRLELRRRCRAAEQLCSRGRILDVGCGTGEFLATMQQRGWEPAGIEPNTVAATYAREHLGLDVQTAKLEEIDLPPATFDVVTLWTVLEHLYDPVSALKAVRRLLRPAGLLIVSVPDMESLDARWFGPYWVGYDTPRHLYVYSRDFLRLILTRAGFEIWNMEHFQADYYTFLSSLEPWLRNRMVRQWPLLALERILKLPGLRMLTWPVFWAINAAEKGCIITIYARPIG